MIEFKIYTDNVSWEDTPVFMTVDEVVIYKRRGDQFSLAGTIAYWLIQTFNTEVRWNWGGSPQGHYVGRRQ